MRQIDPLHLDTSGPRFGEHADMAVAVAAGEAVDEVRLGADRIPPAWFAGGDGADDLRCAARSVGKGDHLARTFRVDDDIDIRFFNFPLSDMLRQKAHMHFTITIP